MVKIIFEAHSTTLDNEVEKSSGWRDVELSELGVAQSVDLGERYREVELDTVFCSDLQRSFKTAEIAFGDRNIQIIKDMRLREIDYGQMSGFDSEEIKKEKPLRVTNPFPGGESYQQACERVERLLEELKEGYEGKTVMIIGHRATQYGLEHWIKGIDIGEAVEAPWKWQPGWIYMLD